MGSERVYGGVGFRELETGRESERGAVQKKKCPIQRDGMSDVADPRRVSWGYGSSGLFIKKSHNRKVESVAEHANFIKESPVRLVSSRCEDFQISRESKNLSKIGSGCSKRPRLAIMEDSHDLDKGQLPKSRANCSGKRSDKRKVSTRTKYDSFSPKNGTAIINSSSGGHNVLGYYGLKPDLHDVTKQVNGLSLTEHSLEELLDDTFSCQDIRKGKGNTTSDTNEKIVESIKNVCSILVSQRPSQIQASSELEGNLNKVMTAAGVSPVSCAPVGASHYKRVSPVIDKFPPNKESCNCPASPAETVNLPLYHPSVVLARLGLQPLEEFESLLSGDVRPVLSVRDGFDTRLGKRLATQPYLPAFSWSHNSGGHCKSTSDALKLSTSRSPCQGSKWSIIGNTACFSGVASNDFTDVTKISFNPNLVPGGDIVSVNIGNGEPGHSPDRKLARTDSRTANITLEENPPSLTAVAQTLCDFATLSLPPDLIQILRRSRKLWDKAPEAQKFKNEDRTERPFSRPKSLLGYDCMARQSDLYPSKKSKLTSADMKKDGTLVNGIAKGPLIWSGPKSCRSSSHRPIKDTRSDNNKPSFGTQPVRILEKGSNSQQKPRKVVQVYWDS